MKTGIEIRQILDQLADNHIVSDVELTFFDQTFHRYVCKILVPGTPYLIIAKENGLCL